MLALLAASRIKKHKRKNSADPPSNGDSSEPSSPHPDWQPGVRNFLSRKLGHLTPSLWFANPYHESRGVLAKEDGGRLRRKEKKVGFIELFYDLFFVAALNVFTRESTFSEGIEVAEYVVFVTLLFSIWISQTYFDARFATTDRLSWLYGFMNLLIYGYIAASSGNFNIAYGLSSSHHSDEAAELVDVPEYIQPVGPVESEDPKPTLISLQAVSAVYAISRVILCVQYLRLVYMARKAGHSVKPTLYNAVGLGLSAACFYAALGLSIGHVTRGKAIARLCMWIIGLLIELTSLVLSATTSRAIWYSLDYWAERFAAVVLIILGEGVIGLFEQFRFVYTGVAVGFRASIIGQLFSAVAIYRIIFAQYFANAHSPDIRGGTATHLLWGLLHYPFIISLLLFLQSVTKSLASTNILIGVQEYVAIIESLETTIDNLSTSTGITIDEYRQRLTSSDAYPSLVTFASGLGVNFDRNLENLASQAGGNVGSFVKMFAGSIFSVTARIFSSYGYDPSAESYTYIDEALSESATPDYFNIFATHVTLLLNPVYTSVVYGFTVLGGYLIFLFALASLEKKRKSVFWKIMYGYRLGLGILMLLLSLLDIGHMVRPENLVDQGTNVAPIYRLLATSTITAILFLTLFSVVVVDLAVMAFKAYHVDQRSKGQKKMSDSEEGENRNEKFSIQRAPTHAAEKTAENGSKPEETNGHTVQTHAVV